MKLRPYQVTLSDQAAELLDKYKIAYIAWEMRTGKTITAFETAKKHWAKRVLFATKKKAIKSIQDDFIHYKDDFEIVISTYQSLHKIEWEFCLCIYDEVHSLISWFPKPSVTSKLIKKKYSHLPVILLSGTPLIESASKAYPQFNVSRYSPFNMFKNFYDWHRKFWIPKQVRTSYGFANDYSEVKYNQVIDKIKHLMLTQTQEDSGFESEITEHILKVKMKPQTYSLIKRLIKDRVIEGEKETILADTWVRLQLTLHQLFSWSVKMESWKAMTLDDSKAQYLKKYFKWKKIAILTCYIQEIPLLKEVFGDILTDDLEEFKTTDKSYVGNIVSNREWISLKEADVLIFYNIPFSWTSYVQWRERLNYRWRKENNVYFICAEDGIELKILKIVRKKQSFSKKIFEKELKDFNF